MLFISRAPPPPSFGGEVLSRVTRGLATFALLQLGKTALTRTRVTVR